jgi:hypothetical protein
MLKPFKKAQEDDYIEDLTCPNPKCRQANLRYVGNDPSEYPDRPKTLECQGCFSKYHVDSELKGFEYPGEPEKKNKRKDD